MKKKKNIENKAIGKKKKILTSQLKKRAHRRKEKVKERKKKTRENCKKNRKKKEKKTYEMVRKLILDNEMGRFGTKTPRLHYQGNVFYYSGTRSKGKKKTKRGKKTTLPGERFVSSFNSQQREREKKTEQLLFFFLATLLHFLLVATGVICNTIIKVPLLTRGRKEGGRGEERGRGEGEGTKEMRGGHERDSKKRVISSKGKGNGWKKGQGRGLDNKVRMVGDETRWKELKCSKR